MCIDSSRTYEDDQLDCVLQSAVLAVEQPGQRQRNREQRQM